MPGYTIILYIIVVYDSYDYTSVHPVHLSSGRDRDEDGFEFWDVVVVTAMDADQREAYELQVERKLARGELPRGVTYIVYADPPGPRLGEGRGRREGGEGERGRGRGGGGGASCREGRRTSSTPTPRDPGWVRGGGDGKGERGRGRGRGEEGEEEGEGQAAARGDVHRLRRLPGTLAG